MKQIIPWSKSRAHWPKYWPKWPRHWSKVIPFFTLLLVAAFVYLGVWQLNRWQEKSALIAKFESRAKEPILLGTHEFLQGFASKIQNVLKDFRFRRLEVSGTLLKNHFLLDNQIYNKQVGFRVLSPLLTADQHIILLDRGWVPLGKNRDDLPKIEEKNGKITVVGIINQPSQGLKLAAFSNDKWPKIIQAIEFQTLGKMLSLNIPNTSNISSVSNIPINPNTILPFILQLEPEQSLSYRVPPISFGIPVSRHLGYAVQWFCLAIAAMVYFLIFSYKLYFKDYLFKDFIRHVKK